MVMRSSVAGFPVVCGVLAACFVGRAAAQSELHYKFKTGDSPRYEVEFKTRATVQGSVISVEFKYDAVWTITAATADGKAKITQKIGRVRFSMAAPSGPVRFDSQENNLTGATADRSRNPFAPFLKAFPGAEITFMADAQGAISDVAIPKKIQEALRELRGGPGGTGETFSAEGFRLLLMRPIQPLPSGPLAKGQTWEQSTEFRMRSGQMKIDVKYTAEGPETRDGNPLERISVMPTLSIGNGRIAARAAVKSQKVTKGFFLFDPAAGRIVESSLTQDMELDVPFGTATETQPIHSTWTVKLMDKLK
jgi:hypothetical protein